MHRHRFSILFLTAALPLAILAPGAEGCECYGPQTAAQARETSAAVFVATVTAVEPVVGDTAFSVTFSVEAAWKGVKQPTVLATTEHWGRCGYPFEVEARYLVYAQAGENGLEVDNCHRTFPLDPPPGYDGQAQRDMKSLGKAVRTWNTDE